MAEMNQSTLYLMLGYPGAGKTTTAKIIAELTGAVRLSSDELRQELFEQPTFSQTEHQRLYQELDARTEQLLSADKSVIYDANLNRYAHRQEKYQICERAGAKSLLVWLRTPKEIAKARAMDPGRRHLIPRDETPEAMFERIAEIIQPPQANEVYVEINGQDVSRESVARALEGQ